MKKLNLDLFKTFLIVILIWIAYSMHNYSNNGRYQFNNPDDSRIIDTRTGKTFWVNHKKGEAEEETKEIE